MVIIILFFIFLCVAHSQEPNTTWLKNITHEVGLDSAKFTKIWIADVNGDNYPDLLCGEGNINRNRAKLFLNIENPDKNSEFKRIFIDVTESSNINENRNPEVTGRIIDIANLVDVDNDGDLDLVTSIYYHRLQMYQGGLDPGDRSEVLINDGTGKFTLKKDAGLNNIIINDTIPEGLTNTTGMAFLDYDYDGNIDLFLSTWFTDYAAFNNVGTAMPSIMLKGNGDGSFTRILKNGVQGTVEPDYGVNVTDWDNDGWQDIITSPYCRTGGALFRNKKDGTFINYTGVAEYTAQKMGGDHGQALCQWEAQPADFDNDGDMDLLQVQVHGGYDEGEGRTHISVNQGPDNGFKYVWDIKRIRRDAPLNSHLGDQGGCWFDINCDGWLDIAIGQMAYPQANLEGQERLYLLLQNKDKFFDDITKQVGLFYLVKEAHSMEPSDFDLDGDQDLFVSHQVRDTAIIDGKQVITNYMRIILLRNDIGNTNNWISVKLDAPSGCNKSAIGARITIYSEGVAQIQEIQTGLGHFAGQQPFIRNFGLGKRNKIDSITVRWPRKDLLTTTVVNPPVNNIIEIDEKGLKQIIRTDIDQLATAENNLLLLYPNPVSESVKLVIPPEFRYKSTLSIYNELGEITDNYYISQYKPDFICYVNNYPPGIYIIRINSVNGKIITGKFIIHR